MGSRTFRGSAMARIPSKHAPTELSYELYRELLEELLSPIETALSVDVRYELYLSKLVYLENLQEQCFRSVNTNSSCETSPEINGFNQTDMKTIQDAIATTHEHLRSTILEAVHSRFSQFDHRDAAV